MCVTYVDCARIFELFRHCSIFCFSFYFYIFLIGFCSDGEEYHDFQFILLYFTIETRWKIITVFSVREKNKNPFPVAMYT
jgi:hypothetical protein